jgi:hypothetical protein
MLLELHFLAAPPLPSAVIRALPVFSAPRRS